MRGARFMACFVALRAVFVLQRLKIRPTKTTKTYIDVEMRFMCGCAAFLQYRDNLVGGPRPPDTWHVTTQLQRAPPQVSEHGPSRDEDAKELMEASSQVVWVLDCGLTLTRSIVLTWFLHVFKAFPTSTRSFFHLTQSDRSLHAWNQVVTPEGRVSDSVPDPLDLEGRAVGAFRSSWQGRNWGPATSQEARRRSRGAVNTWKLFGVTGLSWPIAARPWTSSTGAVFEVYLAA